VKKSLEMVWGCECAAGDFVLCVCVCCVWEILEQNWGIGCVAGVIGVCVCVCFCLMLVCVFVCSVWDSLEQFWVSEGILFDINCLTYSVL